MIQNHDEHAGAEDMPAQEQYPQPLGQQQQWIDRELQAIKQKQARGQQPQM